MKQFFTLIAAASFFAASAQSGLNTQLSNRTAEEHKLIETTASLSSNNKEVQSLRGTGTISDVNQWAWGRSFGQQGATYFLRFMQNDTLGNISGWSTYFDVPTGEQVDVSAVTAYAASIRGDNQPVSMRYSLYAAGADSLPTGMAVESKTVSVDTTTATTIDGFEFDVTFDNPAIFTGDFCVVFEVVGGVGDSVLVLSGATGLGAPDYPFAYQVPGVNPNDPTAFYSGALFGVNFARIPHVYPHVSFDVTNSMMADKDTLCLGDLDVNFMSDRNFLNSEYWTIDGFVGETSVAYWTIDGTAWSPFPTNDTTISFPDAMMDYTVTMHDSFTLWDFSITPIAESMTIVGGAMATDTQVDNVVGGTDADDACANGPGTTTVYTVDGTGVFYTTDVVDCAPAYVPAGIYSDGTTWWQFGAEGVLETSGQCGTSSVGVSLDVTVTRAFLANNMLTVVPGDLALGVQEINVFDLTGKSVISERLTLNKGTQVQISMEDLPAGLYVVHVGNENMKVVK